MKLSYNWSREELESFGIPVIVEGWDKAAGRRAFGRYRREYHRQFTESERRYLSAMYHKKFYSWVLVKGFPKSACIYPEKVRLIQRAANFFATV